MVLPPDDVVEKDFLTFWDAYPARGNPPRRSGKDQALKIWTSLHRKKELPSLQNILAFLDEDSRSEQWKNPKYVPMASTWLNRKPWKDGEDAPPPSTGSLLDLINTETAYAAD